MNKIRMKSYIYAAVIGIGVMLLAGPAQSAAVDPHSSYIGSNFEDYYVNIPAAKVQWSSSMDIQADNYSMGKGVVAVGGAKVFVLQKGQLVAFNVQSGKLLWKYGSKLKSPLLYQEGILYVTSEAGTIYAVNATTGKNKWSSNVKTQGVTQLTVDKDQLFVANGDIGAYRLKDGVFQWRDDYSEGFYEPLLVEGNLVLAENTISGAYMYDVLHALDRTTGKQLWESGNHALPIAATTGTILSQRLANLMDLLPLTTLDSLDVKTGKIVKTVEYNPNHIDPNNPELGNGFVSSGGKAWISGNRMYINEGATIYGYPANTDPATVTRDTYSSTGSGQLLTYAAGPYDGRILFSNGESIYGVKTANKSLVSYSGLSRPIARFDLLGHGMYVAQTDGKLVVINLLTAAPVVQLQTSGRVFGPTILENGMIIVQSKGKLTVFKEPQILSMK